MKPGNSGGKAVDVGGNVVGVAQAGIVATDIHFAISEMVPEFIARRNK